MRPRVALLITASIVSSGAAIYGLFRVAGALDATTLAQVDFVATLLFAFGALWLSSQLFVLARRRDYDQKLEAFTDELKARIAYLDAQGDLAQLAETLDRLPGGPGEPPDQRRRRRRQDRRREPTGEVSQTATQDFESLIFLWQADGGINLQIRWGAHQTALDALVHTADAYQLPTPAEPHGTLDTSQGLWIGGPGYLLIARPVPTRDSGARTRRQMRRGYAGWFTTNQGR